MSSWFTTLGYWEQHGAYAAFDKYREDPSESNYHDAVVQAISIIRVVISTQKFKISYGGDEEDLVSHAALTITKALPKMIKKPKEKLDNDKKYMRYLFTCVVNAFYREYDILHGKHNKLQRKINDNADKLISKPNTKNLAHLEVSLTLSGLPSQLYALSLEMVRFEEEEGDYRICAYILQQLMDGREISKAVLHLMGCKDRPFFIKYCNNLLYRAFLELKDVVDTEEAEYSNIDEVDESLLPLLDWELIDYEDYPATSVVYDLSGDE